MPPSSHARRSPALSSERGLPTPPPTTARGRLAWHACCVGAWAMTSVSGRTQTFCQPGGRTSFCHVPKPAAGGLAEPMVAYLRNKLISVLYS